MRVSEALGKTRADSRALRIVSPAYAGREGELTSTLQYVYQSVLLGGRGEEKTAAALHAIAADEMRHLEILGSLVVRLGAPPAFCACPPYPVSYYSASCVNYARETGEMLEADAAAERASVAAYERMIAALGDCPAACVLRALAEEERKHLALLGELCLGYV